MITRTRHTVPEPVEKPADTGLAENQEATGCGAPRVSVCLPVYNGGKYLRVAIDSILAQTFSDFELIISDNASTDQTEEICKEYADRDPRIRYYRHARNRGGSWNFNHTVELARGEYLKWASHDDVLAPRFLEACVEALDRAPGAVLASPRTLKIDEQGRESARITLRLRTDAPSPAVRFSDLAIGPHGCYEGSGLIRLAVLRKTPLIAPYAGSDRVLLARLGLMGEFREVPEYLFYSRSHAAQSVRSSRFDRMWWFNPSRQGRITFPAWRILVELVKSVFEVRLSLADRVRCLAAALRWPLTSGNGIEMAVDLVRAVRLMPHAVATRLRSRREP